MEYGFPGDTDPTLSEDDFTAATLTTQNYLNDFILAAFDGDSATIVASISTSSDTTSTNPVRIGFQVTVEFEPESTSTPNQTALDNLLIGALSGTEVDNLIADLQELLTTNPFSTTESAQYLDSDGNVQP